MLLRSQVYIQEIWLFKQVDFFMDVHISVYQYFICFCERGLYSATLAYKRSSVIFHVVSEEYYFSLY